MDRPLPRRRIIRRRPPPLEGYYYYVSIIKAIVQFFSYVICMMIIAGVEIRIAERLNASWINSTRSHPPHNFFLNRMDEFFLTFDFFEVDAFKDFVRSNSTEGDGEETPAEGSSTILDDTTNDIDTLPAILGEDPEVLILSLTELRAANVTGLGVNDYVDRITVLNI